MILYLLMSYSFKKKNVLILKVSILVILVILNIIFTDIKCSESTKFQKATYFLSMFLPDSLRKIYTSVPQWLCCVALTFRELRASAVVVTWPIMKWRSSCFYPILSRCSTQSRVSSHSSTRLVVNRCQLSKVGTFFYFCFLCFRWSGQVIYLDIFLFFFL